MAKKYTKSHSNYILRSNPSPTKSGYVYENDLPTTGQKYNSVNGSMITSTDGGFTFTTNTSPNDSKIYSTDGWGQKTYTLSDINLTSNDFQSLDNSNVKVTVKQQKYVKLNKSYTDLSDYCYFGSSNAMLKAAIDDIIVNFPAALYLKTTENSVIIGNTITMTVGITGDTENNFYIDLFDYYPEERINLQYNLKTMASAYMDYEVVLEDETLVGYVTGFTGYTTTNQTNISFKLDNIIGSVSSLLIRPIKSKRDDFFNNLDDFQLALLDQYSVPKYKSYFKIPKEGENGVEFEYKSFNWATTDGYNIDISSSSYSIFMSDLIDATNFIDEIYNDNIYRMLTHDTIKNLDTTYTREIDEDALEEIIIGGTKIQNLLRLYGRSFDELKKYIEGISFANTITFNNENNLPVEYLAGRLETSGWDVFSLLNEINPSGKTSGNLFPSTSESYDVDYVNSEILRRLIVNSNYIFRSKGTKKSIRKILGILGFENDWYETREYAQSIDNLISSNDLMSIAELNYTIYPEDYSSSDGKPDFEYSTDQSLFDNTNIGIMVKCPYCGSENYIVSASNGSENLILNSQYQLSGWVPEAGGISGYTSFNGLPYINVTVGVIGGHVYTPCNINFESGKTYSFGVDTIGITPFRVVVGGQMFNFQGDLNVGVPHRVSATFTFYQQDYPVIYIYAGDGGAGQELWSTNFRNFKVEEGSIATPWSPNPEDDFIDSQYGMCIENRHIFDITGNTLGYPKPMTNTTDYYFQQKGNWYRETGGSHSDLSGNTSVTDISYGNNPHIGNGEYDNGYDYVSQFEDIFKRYVRGAGEGNVVPLSGYTNIGFNMSLPQRVDDTKIRYYDNSYSIIDTKGLLDINLKNFVIGIHGDRILQSFFNNNNSIYRIILTDVIGSYDITGNESEFINILIYGGSGQLSGDYIGKTKSFSFKVMNDASSVIPIVFTSISEQLGYSEVTIPIGTTYLIQFDIQTLNWSINPYSGTDEFNILKAIALPYLEQLIPSTAIFDFMLVETNKPKWLLVDEYCQRDDYGNFTGFKIIAYQNVNYFDDSTIFPDYELTGNTIPKYYGDGFIYIPEMTKSKISLFETEDNNYFTMENGEYSFTETSGGYGNVYFFKKESEDCGLNMEPTWVIDPGLI